MIPTTMELDYTKGLSQPRLVFPKFSDKVIIQLPQEASLKEQDKKDDIFLYASTVKLIEVELTMKISVIIKLFHLKEATRQTRK